MHREFGTASLLAAALAVTGCGEILGIRVYDDDTQDGASAADSSASDQLVASAPRADAAAQAADADAAFEAAAPGDADITAEVDARATSDATADVPATAQTDAVPDADASSMPRDGAAADSSVLAAGNGSTPSDGAVADSSTAAHACKDACAVGAARCSTDNSSVETCQTGADGCTNWAASTSCGSHQTCGVKAGASACSCNPSVCTKTGNVCRDAQTVATCATDANDCPYVASTTACPSPQSCSGSAPNATCALTCASSCTQGETACVSGGLATCTLGTNGCWAYGQASPCGTRQSCVGNAGGAACTCNPDPVCTSLGNTCATSSTLASCAEDAQSCFYQASLMGCTGGETCQGNACSCPTGQTDCDGTCTSVTTDSDNCGACGHNCQGGACLNGQCQPALVASGFVSGDIAVGPDSVYVVDYGSGGRLLRVTKSGGIITPLASGNIWDTAVFGTSLYWTTSTAGGTDGTVTQAALDGSSPVDIATGQATASVLGSSGFRVGVSV